MKIFQIVMQVLILVVSLSFIPSIFLFGNKEKSLKIHREIPFDANANIINIKDLITFVSGIFYLAAFIGLIINNKLLIILGILGTIIFVLFYIYELFLWGKSRRNIWFGFLIVGGISIIIGLYLITLVLG